MPKTLSDVVVDEISLVDDGANQAAEVLIFKRRDSDGTFNRDPGLAGHLEQEHHMDLETIAKALESAEGRLTELVSKLEATEAERDEAATALAKANADLAAAEVELTKARAKAEKAKDGEDEEDDDDAEVMKSLPESLRKRLEDAAEVIRKANERAAAAEAELAKARDAAEQAEAVSKAKAAGIQNAADVAPLLLRVRKGKSTPEDADKLERFLVAASAQATTANLFKSIGSADTGETTDPEALLKSRATEIQKANAGMTYEQAYSRALDLNPGLYGEIQKQRRATAGA